MSPSKPDRPVFEPLVDQVTDELLEHANEVSVAEVVQIVFPRFMALPTEVRLFALAEALMGATGARIERRTMGGRELCNVSTPNDARVAKWSPENERLAAERRGARKPGGTLDS